MAEFKKEVSATERFFAVYNEIIPPFVIHMTLEGDGDPSPESLDEALTRTTEANPGSSLRIDDSGAAPYWVMGPPPTLTVIDAPEWQGDRDGDDFHRWNLDSFTGPTCELVYVRGATKNYLVFRAVHAVMDGQGTTRWVKDFMRCLRGEAPVGHPSTLTIDQLVRQTGAERRPVPKADALHPFGAPKMDAVSEHHWRRIKVPRALDAAVTGRLAVRLAQRARKNGEGAVRLNLPSDLRYLRPDERTTGNMFNSLFVDVPEDASPDMIGMKIMQLLYRKEGVKPVGFYGSDTYVGSIALHRVKLIWDIGHLHDTGRYPASVTLSHLGKLDPAELSAPSFATTGAYYVPLVGDSSCVLTLNGFGDTTESGVGMSGRFGGPAELDELAELVRTAILGD